jgi:hypothetical protein
VNLPRPRIVEKWRQFYRFADRELYVVVIKGTVTQWHCTLRVAELVSDSTDPVVARRRTRQPRWLAIRRTACRPAMVKAPSLVRDSTANTFRPVVWRRLAT